MHLSSHRFSGLGIGPLSWAPCTAAVSQLGLSAHGGWTGEGSASKGCARPQVLFFAGCGPKAPVSRWLAAGGCSSSSKGASDVARQTLRSVTYEDHVQAACTICYWCCCLSVRSESQVPPALRGGLNVCEHQERVTGATAEPTRPRRRYLSETALHLQLIPATGL